MTDFSTLQCVACQVDAPTATDEALNIFKAQSSDWVVLEIAGVKQLQRQFKFGNFVDALAFTQKIGELAEIENHHPSILTEWGKVTVTWWTHKINGLHQNDLIAATKTDLLYN